MTGSIIIIGTGLAGYTLAREIRKRDQQVPLCLITRDDGAFYSKPMLSNALAKQKTADELATADVDHMREELQAEILSNTSVTTIDTTQQRVLLDDGRERNYSRLVLAVGAQPITPQVQGDAANEICTINCLDDYRVFRQRIAGKHTIAIIGPGLIGCEFANDLCDAGFKVHVIGPNHWPLGRLLPAQTGAALQQALQSLGVHWHLPHVVQQVNRAGERYAVHLDDETIIEADVVLSAVGLQPDTRLAQAASLHVNRGIVVDRTLKTSSDNVYALGDCVEVEGMVLPFVMPLMHQARALAATLCGQATQLSYPAMPVLVKTTSYPVVVSPPPFDAPGEWQEQVNTDGVTALFRAGDTLLGFALTGAALQQKQALTKVLPNLL